MQLTADPGLSMTLLSAPAGSTADDALRLLASWAVTRERKLGIGFVPYSPLGHGLLTGQIRTVDDFADDDWRKSNPRFTGENFHRNLAIVDEVTAIGAEIGATPAQTALAWILSRGDDIAPIPGTRRVARVEENTAADAIELTPAQLERLEALRPAAGARHDDANMASIDQ